MKPSKKIKKDIARLAGAWGNMPEMDSIFGEIAAKRKTYKGRTGAELK